jgi:hypothetical protein
MEWVTPNLLFGMCFTSFLLGVVAMLLVDVVMAKRMRGAGS